MRNYDLYLNLDPICWYDASHDDESAKQPLSRLHYNGGITLNGVQFHVTAERVIEVPNTEFGYTVQEPCDDEWVREDLDALAIIDEPDTGWQTVRIGEYDYVLIILPHQR